MEPEKIYDIKELAVMHFPKRHSENYWYSNTDPYIRNYITGQDGLSLSGIGRFGLNRAKNEYMSLGNTFRRKSLSAPEMAKYENKYHIDQSLFDVARDELERDYIADAKKYQIGKMSDRRWNRKSQRYEQQMKNLNENQYVLDQQQNPLKYARPHKDGDTLPLLFSLGLPLGVIGGISAAPYLWQFLNNPVVQGVGTLSGFYNAATEQGVSKTINHFKNNEYWKGVKSALGDTLDISPIFGLGSRLYNGGKSLITGVKQYNTYQPVLASSLLPFPILETISNRTVRQTSIPDFVFSPNERDFLFELGHKLSEKYDYLPLKKLIKDYPRYAAFADKYQRLGLPEEDVYKKIIADRNTVFRNYGLSSNTEDAEKLIQNLDANDRLFGTELSHALNHNVRQNNLLPGVTPQEFELYTSHGQNGHYGNIRMSLARDFDKSRITWNFDQNMFDPSDLPPIHIQRSVKLQHPLNFSGDPYSWFDVNTPIPLRTQASNGELIRTNSKIHPIYLPNDEVVNSLMLKYNTSDSPLFKPLGSTIISPFDEIVFDSSKLQPVDFRILNKQDRLWKLRPINTPIIGSQIDTAYEKIGTITPEIKFVPYGYKHGGKL